VKIDKNKLNTLLRSGLNPDIKTRKQLAAFLALDPTSLTRWFATRDRLGNPRYPVVPDRHVTKILKLFNLTAETLSLSEEAFRQHCFDLSLQHTQNQDKLAEKSAIRHEKVTQRKLVLENYPRKKTNKLLLVIFSAILVFTLVWVMTNINSLTTWLFSTASQQSTNNNKCWLGYSSTLGEYQQEDKADPCHYAKLLQEALTDLKSINANPENVKPNKSYTATKSYILFLSEQLDQRRIKDNVVLSIELGKQEFHSKNYLAAEQFFHAASKLLLSSNDKNSQLSAEISAYQNKIKAALN